MSDLFAEEFEVLDFRTDPEACRQQINAFVANVTADNIKDILQQGQITQATSLVLANAAYFKGDWQSQFSPDDTSMDIFYATPERSLFVPMMKRTGMYNHAVNERLGCHLLEIPYVGDNTEISMVVLLPPSTREALEGVLGRLSPAELERALSEGTSREVQLKLPKFSFEKTYQLVSVRWRLGQMVPTSVSNRTVSLAHSIAQILNELGINDLFQPTANLTGFSAGGHVQLDDAVHKAKIQVDEQGSTAAAATVMFSFRSSRPLEPAQFYCDHPFVFLIYDYRAKAVLFTGVYRGDN